MEQIYFLRQEQLKEFETKVNKLTKYHITKNIMFNAGLYRPDRDCITEKDMAIYKKYMIGVYFDDFEVAKNKLAEKCRNIVVNKFLLLDARILEMFILQFLELALEGRLFIKSYEIYFFETLKTDNSNTIVNFKLLSTIIDIIELYHPNNIT